MGPDRIPVHLLRIALPYLVEPLTFAYNLCNVLNKTSFLPHLRLQHLFLSQSQMIDQILIFLDKYRYYRSWQNLLITTSKYTYSITWKAIIYFMSFNQVYESTGWSEKLRTRVLFYCCFNFKYFCIMFSITEQ